MKRLVILFVVLMVACGLVATTPARAQHSSPTLDCTGYAEPRILLDSQAWWTAMPGQRGQDFGHVHTTVCFPVGQVVRGVVPFDILLTMHENPGKLTKLVIQIGASGQTVAASKTFNPPLMCTATCSWSVHLDANTRLFANDGWQEFRIRPTVVEPDGNRLVGSTSFQAYLANGKPIKNYRDGNYFQGKGWYTDVNYAQAQILSPMPYGPVRGVWAPTVGCRSSKLPVTGCLVTLDPNFHMGDDGAVLFRSAKEYKGTVVIDTRPLPNGWHKLVIRADVRAPADSTASGLLGVWFEVQN